MSTVDIHTLEVPLWNNIRDIFLGSIPNVIATTQISNKARSALSTLTWLDAYDQDLKYPHWSKTDNGLQRFFKERIYDRCCAPQVSSGFSFETSSEIEAQKLLNLWMRFLSSQDWRIYNASFKRFEKKAGDYVGGDAFVLYGTCEFKHDRQWVLDFDMEYGCVTQEEISNFKIKIDETSTGLSAIIGGRELHETNGNYFVGGGTYTVCQKKH